MTHYLIKYNDNYADEFNIHGFQLMTEEEYNEWNAEIRKPYYWPASFQFGSNEHIFYKNFETYSYSITPVTITEQEYNFMEETFSGELYGNFFDATDKYIRFTAVKREKFAEGGVYYVAAFLQVDADDENYDGYQATKWKLLYMPEQYNSPEEVKAVYPNHFEFLTEDQAKKFLDGREDEYE